MKKPVDCAPQPANLKATTILDIHHDEEQRVTETLAHEVMSDRNRCKKRMLFLFRYFVQCIAWTNGNPHQRRCARAEARTASEWHA